MRLGPFYATAWRSAPIYGTTGFWFRLYGYGLHVCNRARDEALFSERYGFKRALYIFGWRIEVLKP